MAPQVYDLLIRHRDDLQQKVDATRQALKDFESDLAETERLLSMTDGAGSHPAEDEKRMNGHEPGAVNGFEPTGTIKEMAFDVLTRTPTGMTTAEVRAAIMTRFGVEVHDPSLPPQLARLKRRGQLTKEGKIWRVTQ